MAQIGGVGYAIIGIYQVSDDSTVDTLTLTNREQMSIRFDFIQELDCPDSKNDDGTIKRFIRGMRIRIEIDFLFDDYTTLTSGTNSWSVQNFLKQMHNAEIDGNYLKVTLHSDKASQIYKVKTEKGWEGYGEAIPGRWNGYRGTVAFIGEELLTSGIDIIE